MPCQSILISKLILKKREYPKNAILGQGQIRLDFHILAFLNSELRIIK